MPIKPPPVSTASPQSINRPSLTPRPGKEDSEAAGGVSTEWTGSEDHRSTAHAESHQIWPDPGGSADLTAAVFNRTKRRARRREQDFQAKDRAVVAAAGDPLLDGKAEHGKEADRPPGRHRRQLPQPQRETGDGKQRRLGFVVERKEERYF